MELPLKSLGDAIEEFDYRLGPEFFREMESTEVLSADVRVAVSVRRSGDIFGLNIAVSGVIGIVCDRCLEQMSHKVDTTYSVSVKFGQEYDDSNDNVIIIPAGDNVMDVSRLVYDTIMLTIPLQHVHPDGECDLGMMAKFAAHRAIDVDEEQMQGLYDPQQDASDDIDDDLEQAGIRADERGVSDPTGDDTECDPRWAALKKFKDNN